MIGPKLSALLVSAILTGALLTTESARCDTVLLQASVGRAIVTVRGSGFPGRDRIEEGVIGQSVTAHATGSEESECVPDFRLEHSKASSDALVTDDGPGNVRLQFKLMARGGRFVTGGICGDGLVIGYADHETAATAATTLKASIPLLVDTSSPLRLKLSYRDMPSGTKISLREGEEPAFEAFEHESEESAIRDITAKDIDGTGSALFETSKAGQYRVEVELRVTVTSSTGTESISERTAGLNITVIE